MAQGKWDKSALSAGDPVSAWSVAQQAHSAPSLSLVDRSGSLSNPVLLFDQSNSFSNQQAVFDAIPQSDQIEVLSRHQYATENTVDFDTGTQFAFFLDGPTADDGYMRVQIYPDDALRISSVQPFGTYGSATLPETSSNLIWQWTRSRIDPDATSGNIRVRAKWWLGNYADEPAAWLLDSIVTPNSGVQLSGAAGVAGRDSGSDYWIDYWAWATDGDSAPGPAELITTAPQNVSGSLSGGSASLTWDAVTGADKYNFEFRRKA